MSAGAASCMNRGSSAMHVPAALALPTGSSVAPVPASASARSTRGGWVVPAAAPAIQSAASSSEHAACCRRCIVLRPVTVPLAVRQPCRCLLLPLALLLLPVALLGGSPVCRHRGGMGPELINCCPTRQHYES